MNKILLACGVAFVILVSCARQKKEADHLTLFRLVDSDRSGMKFRNEITANNHFNVVNQEYIFNGGAVAIGDLNNDGLKDILFTANMSENKLYLNRGDLSFEDVSDESGIGGGKKWKTGAALVDINGDGLLDVYVCASVLADEKLRKNMMFINQGISNDGVPTFVDKAEEYGIQFGGHSCNAGFFDYDNDNDLDLYILTNSRQYGVATSYRPKVNDGSSAITDKLFRNNGNGTFTDASREAGILCEGYGLGLAFLDVNSDGHTDIYVSNDYITNDLLYINNGNGTFTNDIDRYMKHQSKFSMGNDVGDVNNDGYLDILTLDMMPETNLRKKTVGGAASYTTYINNKQFGYAPQHIRNMLQLNNGNGTFSEIGQLANVYQTEWSWSPLFADVDNDGFKDLLVTNGFPQDISDRDFINFRDKNYTMIAPMELLKYVPSVKVANYVLKNNGDLTFSDVSKQWGFTVPSFSNGAAFGDLDNDGDLDYVTNNINDESHLYENTLYTIGKTDSTANHYLRFQLNGPPGNRSGTGAKITLRFSGGAIQYHEHNPYRGYLSTTEDVIHFGLGKAQLADTVLVKWPDGKHEILLNAVADRLHSIDYANSSDDLEMSSTVGPPLVKNITKHVGVNFIHKEDDKIDFNIQRTLPHKFSQSGPGIAVGDINGDDLDDFIVGGTPNYPATIFTQQKNGTFSNRPLKKSQDCEDTGLLLFDVDGDRDLDLYLTGGGYEFPPSDIRYNDRLYKNDGKGSLTLVNNAVKDHSSGSCVRAADFDADGDLDLFVGGRIKPGNYPLTDSSLILRNDQGVFTNVTELICPGLSTLGMVTDAMWSDYNNDDRIDLVIAGEFMPVTFFKNQGNIFDHEKDTGIESHKGWFNSISSGDFDKDGDIDYVAGNAGLNNFYNCSPLQPLRVHAKDFDGNGSIDPILSCYVRSSEGKMESYPMHFWDEISSQSPRFRKKFKNYKDYAGTNTEAFFASENMDGALILDATHLASSYIENVGNGKFKITALPALAQVAPVNGILTEDVNGDDNLDIIMVGNDYGNEPTTGRYDAFTGLILLGDGKGNFSAMPLRRSGFFVDGDAKALVRLSTRKVDVYIASQNRDSLMIFEVEKTKGQTVFTPEILDTYAELTDRNGRKSRIEFYHGAGYLSQSTRHFRIPRDCKNMTVYNSLGKSRVISVSQFQ